MNLRATTPTVLLGLCLLTAAPALAATANFDDDGFPDAAGDGWADAWVKTGSTTATISATDTLDSGNRLDLEVGLNISTLAREYINPDVGNGAGSHTIEWYFRLDEADLTNFTAQDDRVNFWGRSAAAISGGTDSDNSWIIITTGSAINSTTNAVGNFGVFDNNGSSSFANSNMVDSGVALAAGDRYHMVVTVHPTEKQYRVRIENLDTGALFGSAFNHDFRNQGGDGTQHTFAHFGTDTNVDSQNDWSLDTVVIKHGPAVVADFFGGSGDVDGFSGAVAGDGWVGTWGTSGSGLTATISTADPLNGTNDPYLDVDLVNAVSGNQDNEIRREFESFSDLDINKKHKVSWQWRFDGNVVDVTDAGDDRIHFYADNDADPGTNSSNAWLIGLTGDRSSSGFVDGDFYFYDGTLGNGFTGANTVQTGMTLAADVDYFFEVWVDPANKLYNARITDEFGNTFFAEGLGFRNLITGTPGVTWDRLHFGANANGLNDDLSFSIDSIHIEALPTPGAAALGLVGLMPLLVRRRRTR